MLQNYQAQFECLLRLSQLVEQHDHDVDRLLQGLVEILPSGYRNPEHCRVRVQVRDKVFASRDFRQSSQCVAIPIVSHDRVEGKIEIFHLRKAKRPQSKASSEEDSPWLSAVAERVGKMLERIWAERQLHAQRLALEEANAALRGVLSQIEEEKRQVEARLVENVQKILIPMIEALEEKIPSSLRPNMAIVKRHLEKIASPFIKRLSSKCHKLTPSELHVCELIRSGYSSKEIARLRAVSPATVNKQREIIRRKLSLQGTSENLATHLAMLREE